MNFIYKLAKDFIWKQYLSNGFQNLDIKIDNYVIDYWDNNWDNKKGQKTIILLHGFGAQTEFQWYKQVKTLSEAYRVIIPNLLYFGNTKENDKYELQDQVNLVKIMVDNLKLEKIDLVGISYGGLVAIEYCSQNVANIDKLVLIDAPIKFFNNEDLEKITKEYDLKNIEELFAPTDYYGLKKQFRAAYYYKKFIPDFIYKILYENLCLPNVENWRKLILTLQSNLDFYSKKEYAFEQSTLLLWGEKDDIVPSRIGSQLANHLKDGKLEIIKKAKHLPNIEQSKQFNTILMQFLMNNLN